MSDQPQRVNALGQPIGCDVPDWRAPPRPPRAALSGRYCRIEPLEAASHGPELHAAYALDRAGRMWTYLFSGPFADEGELMQWLVPRQASEDPLFFTIFDAVTGRAVGLAAYLRIDPPHGLIEVGHIAFSPLLQRTAAATEAMYLLMKNAFDLGYRRYEWKCDSLNAPSRRAAERLGFKYEGLFRQAVVYKGRNRDTAWYSIIDGEWPAQAERFQRWLDRGNFDANGRQKSSLSPGA
jgi:RimJ/RimL family protein N-acetyltransferase